MQGLPPQIERGQLRVTGISCPDCGGVLGVRTEGQDAVLVFECRIRHTYDVAELLASKEEWLEAQMWTLVRGLHEFAVLLTELAERGPDHGESQEAIRAYAERAARVHHQASALRDVVRANSPVDLTRAEPGSSAVR